MKSKDVIEFFGSAAETGRALGITVQAVCQWGDDVPSTRQRTVELAMAAETERRNKEVKKAERREARRAEAIKRAKP